MVHGRCGVDRRAAVLGALGSVAALAACAVPGQQAQEAGTNSAASPRGPVSSSPAETSVPTTTASGTGESPTPSVSAQSPTPEPAGDGVLSRASVIARYAGRPPTQWGTSVSGVVSRLDRRSGVALTLDACGGGNGGSGYDADLISFLRQRQIPATLFLNQRWIAANPGLAAELVADPLFEVENHGTRHLPLSVAGQRAYGIAGTKDVGDAYDEVMGTWEWFGASLGRPPRFMRPGTAHVDEIASAICRELGQPVAGFSVNADAGASLPADQVAATLARAQHGDIVIAHFNRPGRGTAAGFRAALPQMQDRGVQFVRLRDGF